MLTVGSLFAGIGGFDLGLERAGMRSVWQCEIDPYAIRVLEKHWPDVLRVRDVRDVGPDTVPYVDVICGGFPCQDLSVAGRGAGLDGERSGLWSEYARVLGELRPRYVIVENVAVLLARGLGRVLGDLAALGYDAEWDCIPASAVGAPHQRDRIWLVAYAAGDDGGSGRPGGSPASGARESEPVGSLPVADAGRERVQPVGDAGELERAECGPRRAPRPQGLPASVGDGREDVADTDGAGCSERRRAESVRAEQLASERGREVADAGSRRGAPGWPVPGGASSGGAFGDADGPGWWATEPDVGRVAHGVPARVDRLRGLGNALVPQIAEWIGRRILEWEGVS